MENLNFLQLFLGISGMQLLRYVFLAGGAYSFFWLRKSKFTEENRIQNTPFQKSDIFREISYSTVSFFIFGFVISLPFYFRSHSAVYTNIKEHSYLWWAFTVVALIFINDAYFYWMHRLVHHPKLFNLIHRVHHLSRNPTPFAAYSFHPIETVLESVWILPVLFFIPVHQGAAVTFGIFSFAMNTIGHLGVDIYPSRWKTHPLLKWLNASVHHNFHHQYFNENYGLYFLFWDNWMGTVKLREKKAFGTEENEHKRSDLTASIFVKR